MQRKPKDLDSYWPKEDIARMLRSMADDVEEYRDGVLIKVKVQMRLYHVPTAEESSVEVTRAKRK
jgi:hypothetical protein